MTEKVLVPGPTIIKFSKAPTSAGPIPKYGEHNGQIYGDLLGMSEKDMEALVEAHVEEEVEQALVAGARIVGINNRDLRSFKTDLAVTERLCAMIPDDITIVSESGVRTPADVRRLAASGVSAVLVGESIVTADDAGSPLRAPVAAGAAA